MNTHVTRHLSLVTSAFIAVAAATTVAARTVSVSTVSASSASLAFGGADGATYTLAWGYGASDGGSATNAWDTFEVIGTVAAGDTSRTVALPAGWGDTATHVRFFLLEPEIPADATRLEYIESSGSQWIDSGVRGETGLKFRADLAWDTSHTGSNANADWMLVGARKNTSSDTRIIPVYIEQTVCFGYGKFARTTAAYTLGVRHEIVADFTDPSASTFLYRDGTSINTYKDSRTPSTGSTIDTERNLYIFAANWGGSANYFAKAKLYGLKIQRKNATTGELELVRNFVPCSTNGVGCLYDTVEGRYYGNSGSGSFATGNALPVPLVVSSSFTETAVRPVTVTSISNGNAALSFGAPNGAAYTLACGYGATDGGAATNAWDTFEPLGTIAANATTQTVALPAGWGTTVSHVRFFLLEKPLPSGATRLEYIESSGTQWIDTGVRGRIEVSAEADVTCTSMGDQTILGSRIDDGDTWFTVIHWNAYDLIDGIGGHGYWYWANRHVIEVGDRHVIRSVIADGNQSIYIDGTEIGTPRTCHSAFDSMRSMYLLALHKGSSAVYPAHAKLYSARIWLDGALQRDFVPCRDANDEVCLYDLVSGEYFRNIGSGSFAAGGEIPAAVASSSATVASTIGDDGTADTVLWDNDSLPQGSALVKVGSNRAIVQTASAIAADIDVRGGSLVFSGRTCTNEWYRFLFNGTQYNQENLIAIGDLKVFSDTAGIDNIALGIGANGNVLSAGTSPANLAPGQCVAHFATTDVVPEGVYAELSDMSYAFDGTTKKAVLSADTHYIYNNARQTWVAFRMAEGNNRVRSYLPVKSNFTWYWHPSAWHFQTSTDGVNWQTVDVQTGAIHESGYGSTPFVIKGFLADGAAGFDPAANVKVASGATLDASGVAGGQSLSHLTVDWAAGAGTITGVTIAQNGVLDLVNVPAGAKLGGATIPVALHQTTGAANFGTWTLRVNGTATEERLYWNGSALRIPGALVLSVW